VGGRGVAERNGVMGTGRWWVIRVGWGVGSVWWVGGAVTVGEDGDDGS
jgi:hypothetical protein